MPRRQPKSIIINGRRWFQRSAGNTYFSSTIYIDGEEVHYIPFEYGYGGQYLDSSTKWLAENGYLPGISKSSRGGYEPVWRYAQRKNIKMEYDVVDVGRKKDL